MSGDPIVAAFIGDVKQILEQHGAGEAGLGRIAERMRRFVRDCPPEVADETPAGNVHTGRQSAPLYTDESGLTLVRGRFGPEAMTPIHNHGTWGVIGVYRGRDRYQVWRRLDEGGEAGPARIDLVEERVLGPGDVVILPPPPQDIHAQQGEEGEAAYEFVLFGKNAMALPRLYFDPAQGLAREVQPGKR
jgi:predicted metal-dependent enzyme (double-stranded beta helix superfamily)